MKPDDPRHGTTRGYHAGCHDICCRAAMARYEKAGRLARLNGGRAVPAIGTQRRIQALMRLGWTSTDIATEAGWQHRNGVLRILNGQKGRPTRWVERKTADTIAAIYARLSMQTPEMTPTRARTRARAERLGYAPPLAWDDIDNPDEQPQGTRTLRTTRERRPAGRHSEQQPCERCGVVRWVNAGAERLTPLCADCRLVVAA